MLNAGYSWRLFFYVCIAFAGTLLIAAFIFVEESTYVRKVVIETPKGEFVKTQIQEEIELGIPGRGSRKTWREQLKLFNGIDYSVSYWMTTFRPFTYLVVPAVFWVIATYGIVPPISSRLALYLIHSHPFSSEITGGLLLFIVIVLTSLVHRSRRLNLQLHLPHHHHRPTKQLARHLLRINCLCRRNRLFPCLPIYLPIRQNRSLSHSQK